MSVAFAVRVDGKAQSDAPLTAFGGNDNLDLIGSMGAGFLWLAARDDRTPSFYKGFCIHCRRGLSTVLANPPIVPHPH